MVKTSLYHERFINSIFIKSMFGPKLFVNSQKWIGQNLEWFVQCIMASKLIKPKNPAAVKKLLQITIPMVIHNNKRFLGAPSPIPSAATEGCSKNKG